MRAERAAGLIVDAYNLGQAKTLANRIQRDLMELRIIAPQVAGDGLDPLMTRMTEGMEGVQALLDRIQIDTVRRSRRWRESPGNAGSASNGAGHARASTAPRTGTDARADAAGT